jgi:hypothetical protein
MPSCARAYDHQQGEKEREKERERAPEREEKKRGGYRETELRIRNLSSFVFCELHIGES